MKILPLLRAQFQLFALKNQYRTIKSHAILMTEIEQYSYADELNRIANSLQTKIQELRGKKS